MRYLLALTAAFWALPALAQSGGHEGHDMSGMDMSGMDMSGMEHGQSSDTPSPAPAPAPTPAPSPSPSPDQDAMPGMDMSMPMPMDHSAHAMPMDAAKPIMQSPPPPAALSGPAHAADAYFPGEDMKHARMMMTEEMGGPHTTLVMLDRLEVQAGEGADGWAWEGGLRSGGDIDRLWVKTEGEGEVGGGVEDAEVQALWSHAIGRSFDLQAGLREQFLSGSDRTQFAVGVQGLAPYMFDISAAAFVSTQGEFTAKIGAEIDQRMTQRLILQPRVEANLSAQDIPALGLGSGVTSLQAGLRLRYEIRREFAPYVGVEWQKQFGRTATFTRSSGGNPDRVVVLAGLRAWF